MGTLSSTQQSGWHVFRAVEVQIPRLLAALDASGIEACTVTFLQRVRRSRRRSHSVVARNAYPGYLFSRSVAPTLHYSRVHGTPARWVEGFPVSDRVMRELRDLMTTVRMDDAPTVEFAAGRRVRVVRGLFTGRTGRVAATSDGSCTVDFEGAAFRAVIPSCFLGLYD